MTLSTQRQDATEEISEILLDAMEANSREYVHDMVERMAENMDNYIKNQHYRKPGDDETTYVANSDVKIPNEDNRTYFQILLDEELESSQYDSEMQLSVLIHDLANVEDLDLLRITIEAESKYLGNRYDKLEDDFEAWNNDTNVTITYKKSKPFSSQDYEWRAPRLLSSDFRQLHANVQLLEKAIPMHTDFLLRRLQAFTDSESNLDVIANRAQALVTTVTRLTNPLVEGLGTFTEVLSRIVSFNDILQDTKWIPNMINNALQVAEK